MPCTPGAVSIVRDPTAEAALAYLPARGHNGDHLYFYAANAARVDAVIAVAMRSCIEHFGGYVRIPVRLVEAPADEPTWRALDALLGTDLPATYSIGQAAPTGEAPTTVILPAVRIGSYDFADQITDAIVDPLGRHHPRKLMRYVAGSFAALVENGLDHAKDSTVDVIASIAYDRDADQVRLAVTDTGESMSVAGEDALRDALDRSRDADGGLHDLAARVAIVERDVAITLATGTARARSDGGEWTFGTGEYLDGFTASVSVRSN
jgi:hypothetical protein